MLSCGLETGSQIFRISECPNYQLLKFPVSPDNFYSGHKFKQICRVKKNYHLKQKIQLDLKCNSVRTLNKV